MAKKTSIVSIKIVSNANTRGFKKAARAANSLSSTFTKSAIKIGGASTAIASAAAIAGGAVGQIAAGAVALGAVAGPALGAVALGLDGIKEAALNAQEGFDSIKSEVSGTFAEELAAPFARLSDALVDITPHMTGLASSLSGLIGGVMDTITGEGLPALQDLISAASQFTDLISPGMNSLVTGVLAIGPALLPAVDMLGGAFNELLYDLGDMFTHFADSGATTKLIESFSQALSGLSSFLGPVLDLFVELGIALGPHLGNLFASLGDVVAALVEPLSTVANVAGAALVAAIDALVPAIGPLMGAIATLVTAIGPLLPAIGTLAGALGTVLAQAVEAVAPFIAELAEILGGALGAVAEYLPDLIAPLIDHIGRVGDITGEIIPVVAEVAKELFPAFMEIVDAILPLLPILSDLVSRVVQALLPLVPPLLNVAKQLFPALAQIVEALTPVLEVVAGVIAAVVEALVPIIEPLLEVVESLLPGLVAIVEIVAPVLEGLGKIIGWVADKLTGVLVWAIKHAIGWLESLVGWVSDALGWVSDLIGGMNQVSDVDPYGGYSSSFQGASDGGLITQRTRLMGPRPRVQPTTQVNITVNGAIDPYETGRQIRKLLNEYDTVKAW